MKPKKRYILAHHSGTSNMLEAIVTRYAEKFGNTDLEKASLKVISDMDGFLILRCGLDCIKHLSETLTSLDGNFVTLNMSGTLKALRSREEGIKKRFMSGNRY